MVTLDFEQWLERYGNAWTDGDPDAAVRLFTPGAAYYETPFDAPMTGADALRRVPGMVASERNVAAAKRRLG